MYIGAIFEQYSVHILTDHPYRNTNSRSGEEKRSSPEIARSQKIENLIKKVAENKTRARLNTRYSNNPQQNLQVKRKLPGTERNLQSL